MANSTVTARCAIGLKQALLNPIDHGPRIHVQQSADLVCRVDGLRYAFCVCHTGQNSLPNCRARRRFYFLLNGETVIYLNLF